MRSAKCLFVKCPSAKCRFAKCPFAKCQSAFKKHVEYGPHAVRLSRSCLQCKLFTMFMYVLILITLRIHNNY